MTMPPHEVRAVRDIPLSQRILGAPPARTLEDAVRLCDPFTPLDPTADRALRADLDPIRGGDRLAKIVRNIRRAGGTPTLHFLTGHVGSGKTTELLRVKQRLVHPEGKAPANTVFFLDADALLDRHDIDLEDIVVALWSVLFRESPAAAAKVLSPVWKKQVEGALKGFVVNLPDKVPEAVGAVLGQLKLPGLEQRQKLRVAVGSLLGALIEGLNAALQEVRRGPEESVVILLDNLEKLSQGQRAGVERLYLERMGALKDLDAHLVITVPLYLCYAAAGASLIGLYGGEIVVLPMVKVRHRQKEGGHDDKEGLAAMVDVLTRRVDFGALFEGGTAAAEEIARFSGGCIRHALRMVQAAANEHDNPPITADSIKRAAASIQGDFERALPERWVPILRAVARDNRFPDTCEEEPKRELLRHLFVLEYQNGDPDPWYGVHPLVERCRKYREHGP
jgi:AAA ATPase domain